MSRRESWNERYAAKELIWSAGPNVLFAEAVRPLNPGRAIDAACGEGRNALWLAEQGWSVTADRRFKRPLGVSGMAHKSHCVKAAG